MRQRGGSRKRDTRIRTPREGEVGPEGRHNAAPCQATAVASPMRVRLFNLPILLLPLLAALLSPIFVCSFVLVAPPINSLSPRPSFRCEEGSRTGRGGVGSGLGPAARVAPAAAAVARRCRICRPSGTRTHALQDEILEGIAAVVDPGTEVPVEKLRVPREPPERPPFDLDAAVFLADFAFEAYREPERGAWEAPGPSSVRFKDGDFVSKVFPGLLTVSLLAAEKLPVVLEPIGSDPSNKRERAINPSVAMVLADKDIRSGTMTTTKRPLPGGRCWNELFSMHVHDPETSVLEIGLWDKGEEGAIPLSVTDVFRGAAGKELVGTATVPLSKILRGMLRGRDDSWTGWVEVDPIALEEEVEADGEERGGTEEEGGREQASRASGGRARRRGDGVGSGGGVLAARLHLDLRFASMEKYHGDDLPTAPRASEEDVAATESLASTMRARWQELVGEDGGADGDDDSDAASVGNTKKAEYAPGLSANRTFVYEGDGDGIERNSGSSVIADTMDRNCTATNSTTSGGGSGGDRGGRGSGGAGAGSAGADSSTLAPTGGGAGGGGGTWPWSRGIDNTSTDTAPAALLEGDRLSGSLFSGGVEGIGARKATGGTGDRDGKRRSAGARAKSKKAAVVLREDGMPDWRVLTNRIGGLAQQAGAFEFLCFIDNHDTDTQVGVWRDEANKRLVVSFRGTAQFEDVLTDVNILLDDLDHSGVSQKVALPAVDDVMAAVFNTTASWKKERVQPIPVTLAQQKVYLLESMNKLLDTSRELLNDLQVTTAPAAGTNKRLSDKGKREGVVKGKGEDEGGGGEKASSMAAAGVTVRPAEEILSGVKGLLRLGGAAEPASAAEVVAGGAEKQGNPAATAGTKEERGEISKEEKNRTAAASAAAAAATNLINLLGSSNRTNTGTTTTTTNSTVSGNENSGERRGGVIRRGAGNLLKRWKGPEEEQDGGGGGGMFPKKKGPPGLVIPSDRGGGVERGLADTLTWVQQVAGEKMEELASLQTVLGDETKKQMQLLSDVSEGKVNATESGEMLAQFLREQLEKVEATKELVDRVEEFRDSVGAATVGVEWDGKAGSFVGLEALQERVQEQGRKAVDDKIVTFQEMLANVTALQQQQQQQQWSTDVASSDGDGGDQDDGDGGETTAAARRAPKIHSGFKRAYVSVNGTLSAVLRSAMEGKPEDWHVYITGHSLGGALATIATLDHKRRYPDAKVTMYNFGSPRVGNRAFAELYDSFVGDSFRVVNNLDVVARMPRATMGGISLDYQHAGRTVMVAEDPEEPPWIQGESAGECPLEETDPVAILTKGNTDFFTAEIEFMKALFTGKGIDHHMEHNYFAALDSFYDPDDVKEA